MHSPEAGRFVPPTESGVERADETGKEKEKPLLETRFDYRTAEGKLMCTAVQRVEIVERTDAKGGVLKQQLLRELTLENPFDHTTVDALALAGIGPGGNATEVRIDPQNTDHYNFLSKEISVKALDDPMRFATLFHEAGHAEQFSDGSALNVASELEQELTKSLWGSGVRGAKDRLRALAMLLPDLQIDVPTLELQIDELNASFSEVVDGLRETSHFKEAVEEEKRNVKELLGKAVPSLEFLHRTAFDLQAEGSRADRQRLAAEAGIDLSDLSDETVMNDGLMKDAITSLGILPQCSPRTLVDRMDKEGFCKWPVYDDAELLGYANVTVADFAAVKSALEAMIENGVGDENRRKYGMTQTKLKIHPDRVGFVVRGEAYSTLQKGLQQMRERDATAKALRNLRRLRQDHGIDLLRDTVVAYDTTSQATADQNQRLLQQLSAQLSGERCVEPADEPPDFVVEDPASDLRSALETYDAIPAAMRRRSVDGKRIPRAVFPKTPDASDDATEQADTQE